MRTFTCRSTFLYVPGERGGKGGGGRKATNETGSFFYGGPDYIFIGPVEWIQQATSIPQARIGKRRKTRELTCTVF
jgi:hypothetical protein